jgi:hypothetical protein
VYQDRPALPLPRQEHSQARQVRTDDSSDPGRGGSGSGSVTTVVGTIIGTFFGVQAGAAGKEAAEDGRAKAEAGRAQAENAARVALAHLEPAAATEVMKLLPPVRSGR